MGVIHSDLRPENILVDPVDASSLSVWLCDFGESACEGLGLDGGHLPDTPFFDPRMKWESTPATDIFSYEYKSAEEVLKAVRVEMVASLL